MADMNDILNLVKAGRLEDATSAIQSRLTVSPHSLEPEERPMKDITPTQKGLASSTLHKRQKPARAKPSVSEMTRHNGPLSYHLYTPAMPVADAPLIVMLHGCTQSPDDFATGTRMNAAADAIGAHVIWPEQTLSANANLCWNWFEPAHQARSGEAAAIAHIAATVKASHTPEALGVHVAGLSAGGAMAAILGTQYSDIFASVGIHSGLPAGSARDMGSAFVAMNSGGTATQPLKVPSIIFHGTADRTVALSNATAIAPSPKAGCKPRLRTSDVNGRRVTVSRTDAPLSELWKIEGLGHAWSGGDTTGSFADPKGPDATAEMIRFFQSVGGS